MAEKMLHRFIDGVEVKQCHVCSQWKPLAQYTSLSAMWDGLSPQCGSCRQEWYSGDVAAKSKEMDRKWREQWAKDHEAEIKAAAEARAREWRKSPEGRSVRRAIMNRYRARKRGASGYEYTTAEHIEARCAMWGHCCYLCGEPMQAIDHVIPLAKGGAHWPANLRPICTRCNTSKKDQWPYDLSCDFQGGR